MIRFIIKPILAALFIFSMAVLLGFFVYCAVILIWSPSKDIPQHDAIIVLTGSKGRIESGFNLLLDNKAPQMHISGVLSDVNLAELIDLNVEDIEQKQINTIKNHCCISLDYVADTTETNAIETNKWVTDNDIKSIILVTSASHMPRAYLLFHRIMDQNIKITPYPYASGTRLRLVMSSKFWDTAAREYIKFGGNLIRLERQ